MSLTATTARVLVLARKSASETVQVMLRIPAALAGAFASVYVDPYQPRNTANDPADPRNF
jgi:hypothetical protein